MANPFEFYTAARIIFGENKSDQLGEIVATLGLRPLLLTGASSARQSGLLRRLEMLTSPVTTASCAGEPTIAVVDAIVAQAKAKACDVVIAVGGGSVLDCGKAAAAMVTNAGSLLDYLEGVGQGKKISAAPLPLVAMPTTAGTGSEVTKNAVISGEGYKKSVRSPLLIPDVALVDPLLTHGAPTTVTAACGMDALTQLIEAYLSVGASAFTDPLALRGIVAAGGALLEACQQPSDSRARTEMALASVLGGVCLANAGLGAVHGFASPIGAHFPIGHGLACATLLPTVLRANLSATAGSTVERRYRRRLSDVGRALGCAIDADEQGAIAFAIDKTERLKRELAIPRLGQLGVDRKDFARIVSGARGSSMRFNPITLSDEQLVAILDDAF